MAVAEPARNRVGLRSRVGLLGSRNPAIVRVARLRSPAVAGVALLRNQAVVPAAHLRSREVEQVDKRLEAEQVARRDGHRNRAQVPAARRAFRSFRKRSLPAQAESDTGRSSRSSCTRFLCRRTRFGNRRAQFLNLGVQPRSPFGIAFTSGLILGERELNLTIVERLERRQRR